MKSIRWRSILSVGNLLLAWFLQFLGWNQYQFVRGARPHAVLLEGTYMPTAHQISYSINAPSFIAGNLIRTLSTVAGLPVSPTTTFHYGYVEYYVALFIFWWCVGWRLDRQPNYKHRMFVVANALGTAFSVDVLSIGIDSLFKEIVPPPVSIAIVVWGVALLAYFASSVRALRAI